MCYFEIAAGVAVFRGRHYNLASMNVLASRVVLFFDEMFIEINMVVQVIIER